MVLTAVGLIVAALFGGGGIGALLRARSGSKVDRADAATKVVDTSIRLMEELREERSFARTEVHALKNEIMGIQGRHAQELLNRDEIAAREAALRARDQIEREALVKKWEQCERRSADQDHEIRQQGDMIASLTEAVDALKLTVAQVAEGGRP